MAEINTPKEYDSFFNNEEFIKCAYKEACKNREFEINLYWKRTIYFWTFIGVSFGGYFLLEDQKFENVNLMRILICLVGLIFSVAWFLANKGSKYWQENWETHVALLERKITGPLHMTILKKEAEKKFTISKAYPFSVTKINSILSFFVIIVWILQLLYTLAVQFFKLVACYCPEIYNDDCLNPLNIILNSFMIISFIILTIIIVIKLFTAESDINNSNNRNLMDYNIAFKTIDEEDNDGDNKPGRKLKL